MSDSFNSLTGILQRIESHPFLHVWISAKIPILIQTECHRLGLRFKYDENSSSLISHEYPGMKLGAQQNIGTLVGLKNLIVLEECEEISPLFVRKRKIIIPHGAVESESVLGKSVCTTRINLNNLREPKFFVYDMDDHLKILRGGRDQTAWFYLAHLHAVTSTLLPDLFTKVTGTEMAFQILQSARCWSSKPYASGSLSILRSIAELTPIRAFYPVHLQCMQTISWPPGIHSSTAHEGFVFIVEKLIQDSLQLSCVFGVCQDSMTLAKTIKERVENRLHKRHYCRQIQYGNPMSSISPEVRNDLECMPATLYLRPSLLTRHEILSIQQVAIPRIKWLSPMDRLPDFQSDLLNKSVLKGKTTEPERMIAADIQDVMGWDVTQEWINLFLLAREVDSNEWHDKWAIILSLLALKGAAVDNLLLFHRFAVYGSQFCDISSHKLCTTYIEPAEGFSRNKINYILTSNKIDFCPNDYAHFTKERRQEEREGHERQFSYEVNMHCDAVERQWISDSYIIGFQTSRVITLSTAVSQINSLLRKWINNLNLKTFLTAIKESVNRIPCDNVPLHPRTAWIEYKNANSIPNLETFKLEFEQFMVGIQDLDIACEAGNICGQGLLHEDNLRSIDDDDVAIVTEAIKSIQSQRKKYEVVLEGCWMPPNIQFLVDSCLYPRISPSRILSELLLNNTAPVMKDIRNLILTVAVFLTKEQRLQRICAYRMVQSSRVALEREYETIGFELWEPARFPQWVILQLEMNMMIRPIQQKVAFQMMDPESKKNSVLQLNMGEGKTALIVPMLASVLGNGKQLIRLTVLKSIFNTNFNALRHTLGGILNMKVCSIPCNRTMNIGSFETAKLQQVYETCLRKKMLIVTLPEYRLSFQLKGYEQSLSGTNVETAKSLLGLQRWLEKNTRDILDESDEILSVKYQLLYTVGSQIQIDGGCLRWKVAQKLLKLLVQGPITRMECLQNKFGESAVEYEKYNDPDPTSNDKKEFGRHSGVFSPCRLVSTSKECYEDLIDMLADDFLDGRMDIGLPSLQKRQRELIKKFVTQNDISEDEQSEMIKEHGDYIAPIFIVAGYLKYGILQSALSKRWRVNYGVNLTGKRKMAVPFKAKDVASERTEFGHPDMAIILTHLSYYYSGLSDEEIMECFHVLKTRNPDPANEYASWIREIPSNLVDDSVKRYKGINLSDYNQKTEHLFPMLRKAMIVVDFWLSNVVLPRECKQFPQTMTCTAWDLVREDQECLTTGFSGTNDSEILYPLTIKQNDLTELSKTNDKLQDVLLKPENNNYKDLPAQIMGVEILKNLANNHIKILLDCGALMLDLDNKQVANEWLQQDQELEAVVIFDKNELVVKSRGQKKLSPLELSPFRERLDSVAVYLDDEHTRGTDLKFPRGSQACVTIGSGLTRDKMVQACMRMRLLGKGHTVTFWASNEAHNKIAELHKNAGNQTPLGSEAVLAWVKENTKTYQEEGLIYWTESAANYCLKRGAEHLYYKEDQNNPLGLEFLGRRSAKDEIFKLKDMYCHLRIETLFVSTIYGLFSNTKKNLLKVGDLPCLPKKVCQDFSHVESAVIERCKATIPHKTRLVQKLDEEQEKELENEIEEEKEMERPPAAKPYPHALHALVKDSVRKGSICVGTLEGPIHRLPDVFNNTEVEAIVQSSSWGDTILVTTDFIHTVQTSNLMKNVDDFLRLPVWIVSLPISEKLLVISPFEANWLMPYFRSDPDCKSTLHMYAPRHLLGQETLISTPEFAIPSSGRSWAMELVTKADLWAPLALLSGTLFFESAEEQKCMMNFLGLFSGLLTERKHLLETGKIDRRGFILDSTAREKMTNLAVCFEQNPCNLVEKILGIRHLYIPPNSHLGKLSKNGIKMEDSEFKSCN